MSGLLVVGGSGRTGRRVVEGLRAARRPVAVLSRRPVPAPGVTAIVGDLGEGTSWTDVLGRVSGVAVCVEPPYDAAGAVDWAAALAALRPDAPGDRT